MYLCWHMDERCNFSKVLMVVSACNSMEGWKLLEGIQERGQSVARNAAVGKADRILFAPTGSCSAWFVQLELKFVFLRGSLSENSHHVSKNQSDNSQNIKPFSCLIPTRLFVHCIADISTWKYLLYSANAWKRVSKETIAGFIVKEWFFFNSHSAN